MTHQTDDQKNPVPQSTGRPYHSPRLLVYGAIRELTTAGTAGTQESQFMILKSRRA